METLTIEMDLKTDVERIRQMLDALLPWVDASEANRQTWNRLVDALEDAEDQAAFDEWEAAGKPTIPFDQVLKEAGMDPEALKREL